MNPERIINSVAPIRICDNGGWTDTWFAEHGKVFNIGVSPVVEAQIEVYPASEQNQRVLLVAENFGDRYAVDEDKKGWIKHPLLEAAIKYVGIPDDKAVVISLFSEAPAGCSTGTSASVSVALIAALSELSLVKLTPEQSAYTAHKIETEILHQQCGIQDQLCAAYGGINFIDMHTYPKATVFPIKVPDEVWWELERRLCLIYLGEPHASSPVHEMVIKKLEGEGPDNPKIQNLRRTAEDAREALLSNNFVNFGLAMRRNNEHQRELHPDLISPAADQIFEIAESYGALGWKVNGAGGKGGSVTLLAGSSMQRKREMITAIEAENVKFRSIPVSISRLGLHVWSRVPEKA